MAAYALWTRRPTAVAVTYYWGLVLSSQGLVTPSLSHSFLIHKPPASVLDLLGPWPSYVGLEVLLVSGIWALMTWPWQRRTDVALERAGLHSEA